VITLVSRILGLLRDMVLTTCFGMTWVADVFVLAFEIPNLARRILGEGSLSAFIVPVFSKVRAEEGMESAWKFACNALTVLAFISLGLTALGILLARPLFSVMGYGYVARHEVEAILLGVRLTRIMFPFLMLLTLSSILMGLCHSLRHFTMPALGSIMLNICMIVTGLVFFRCPAEILSQVMAIAVLIGGGLRLIIMIPPLTRAGFHYRPVFAPRSDKMRQLFLMMLPAFFGLAVVQINISVSRAFATLLGEGLVICLMLSNRLVQLPLAIIGASLSTAILPQLSQFRLENRTQDLVKLVRFAFGLILIIFVPATVGLCVLGMPMIDLIFRQGKWTEAASRLTHQALIFYALGLVMWGLMRILIPIYYADRDVRTPVRIGAVSMIVNVLLNILLITVEPLRHTLGHAGLALANTLSVVMNTALLLYILQRRGLALWSRALCVTALKTCAAALVMGLFAWFLWDWLGQKAIAVHRAVGGLALAGTVLASGGLYAGIAVIMRVPDLKETLAILLRRRTRDQ